MYCYCYCYCYCSCCYWYILLSCSAPLRAWYCEFIHQCINHERIDRPGRHIKNRKNVSNKSDWAVMSRVNKYERAVDPKPKVKSHNRFFHLAFLPHIPTLTRQESTTQIRCMHQTTHRRWSCNTNASWNKNQTIKRCCKCKQGISSRNTAKKARKTSK